MSGKKLSPEWEEYDRRCLELEAQGMTRSDAQAVLEARELAGGPRVDTTPAVVVVDRCGAETVPGGPACELWCPLRLVDGDTLPAWSAVVGDCPRHGVFNVD